MRRSQLFNFISSPRFVSLLICLYLTLFSTIFIPLNQKWQIRKCFQHKKALLCLLKYLIMLSKMATTTTILHFPGSKRGWLSVTVVKLGLWFNTQIEKRKTRFPPYQIIFVIIIPICELVYWRCSLFPFLLSAIN